MSEIPRLSESLHFPRRLDTCQACGTVHEDQAELIRWQEHDAADRPEQIAVVLCRTCSERLIEPHPRLYSQTHWYAPLIGAMPICNGCTHRHGLRCTNPLAIANGGLGMPVYFPRPTVAFVDGVRNGRRTGWRETMYHGPVIDCNGREEVQSA